MGNPKDDRPDAQQSAPADRQKAALFAVGCVSTLGISMKLALAVRSIWISSVALLSSAHATPIDLPDQSSDFASVHWHQVSAPFGRYLLMRGAEGVCGIRFTNFNRLHDKKPATMFHSGEETMEASYEWHFVEAPVGEAQRLNAQYGSGKVATGPLKGIGRLAFQTRDPIIKCGPFRAFWLPPSSVSFSAHAACKDAKYELAPTNWQVFEEIEFDSHRLQWFKCDELRKSFQIPASGL